MRLCCMMSCAPGTGVEDVGYPTAPPSRTKPCGAEIMPATPCKEKIMEVVKASFAYAKEKAVEVPEDQLAVKVETPFGEFTKQNLLLIMLEHSGEHKGQLIAYARMNGITPPWSQ